MGAGLILIGATLHLRFDFITKFLNLKTLIEDTDLVFTAEGGIAFQTPRGKIPSDVARIAKLRAVPVIALAGTVGEGADTNYEARIDAFTSILQGPSTLIKAIADAERLLTEAVEIAMRMVMVGRALMTFGNMPPRAEAARTNKDELDVVVPAKRRKQLISQVTYRLSVRAFSYESEDNILLRYENNATIPLSRLGVRELGSRN